MVSPYFLFFLIHSSQTGVAVLSFQVKIIGGAGHDAWLIVLALGLFMHVIYWMILYILKHSSSGDILSFHKDLLGKFMGGLLNLFIAIYFSTLSLYTLHTYIDILQIWVFDGIASWEFSLLFTVLIFYIVSGGFRILTATAFWGVIIPSFLLLSLIYLLGYIDVSYLFPLLRHNLKDYFNSAKEATSIYLGFETILIFYPFIKNWEKAHKWGHLALFYTTFLYTLIAVITFMFFTQGKIEHLTWPTLTMIKIIQLPFLERFEFIFIFTWLLVVIPVICIYLWSAIRSIKLTIPKVKQTYVLILLLAVFYFINSLLVDIEISQLMTRIVGISGIIFLFCYIPVLFIISVIRKKLKKS